MSCAVDEMPADAANMPVPLTLDVHELDCMMV